MPVFGAFSSDELKSTCHSCGLLYSDDRGKTWAGSSVIARGNSDVSYEYPAVMMQEDGSMTAILTARKLKRDIDAVQVLVRVFSDDGGKTWTEPEQLCVGAWPGVALTENGTAVCAYSVWSAWGEMRLLVSADGFRTFSQDLPFVEHGWLPIPDHYEKKNLYPDKELIIEKFRNFWAYNPIPLPPTVPFMDGDWEAGHYGFPSVLYDEGSMTVVLGNRQKGNVYIDPPEERNIPLGHERIEAISFDLTQSAYTRKPRAIQDKGKEKWKISESWTPDEYVKKTRRPILGGPDEEIHRIEGIAGPKASLVLRSGRWINMRVETEEITDFTRTIVGRQKGYWIHNSHGMLFNTTGRIAYSDDDGSTWSEAPLEHPVSPDGSMLYKDMYQAGPAFEEEDGTLLIPMYGYRDRDDMYHHRHISVLLRSHDSGETWGDWSVIANDADENFYLYNETTIIPVADDYWISFIRTETITTVPWMSVMITRAVSTDKGYTWTKPETCFVGSQPAAIRLPDGGIAVIVRSHSRQASGVYFSYDAGETFDYALAGPYNTQTAGMLDDGRFWIYAGNEVVIYGRA